MAGTPTGYCESCFEFLSLTDVNRRAMKKAPSINSRIEIFMLVPSIVPSLSFQFKAVKIGPAAFFIDGSPIMMG